MERLEIEPARWKAATRVEIEDAVDFHNRVIEPNLGGVKIIPPSDCQVVSWWYDKVDERPYQKNSRKALKALRELANPSRFNWDFIKAWRGFPTDGLFLGPPRWPVNITEEEGNMISNFITSFGPLTDNWCSWVMENTFTPSPIRYPSATSVFVQYTSTLLQNNIAWMATPVWFYTWSANMITALIEHSDWKGCNTFLSKRLMSMTVIPSLVTGKWKSLRLIGGILESLAYTAAFGRNNTEVYPTPCEYPGCENEFITMDRRYHYCEEHRRPDIQDALRHSRARVKPLAHYLNQGNDSPTA